MLSRVLLIFMFLTAQTLWAEDSFFHKLSVLRLRSEEIVRFENGVLDLSKLGNTSYFHAQGEVYFIPGVLLDPVYYDKAGFQKLVQERKAILSRLKLKTFPDEMPGTKANFGTFVLRFQAAKNRRLGIALPRLFHATEVTYVDSIRTDRILVHGTIDPDPNHNNNAGEGNNTPSFLDVSDEFLLFVKVSGPFVDGKNTLNLSSLYVGDEPLIRLAVAEERLFAALISGTFFTIFIFHLFIFSFRRRDVSPLYLCLYALCCFGMSVIHTVNLPWDNFEILTVFTCVDVLSIAFLQTFLFHKISFCLSRRTHRMLVSLAFGEVGFTVIGLITNQINLVGIMFVCAFFSAIILILVTSYLGIKHRLSGIGYFLVGIVLSLAFHYPIVANYNDIGTSENGYNILLANFCIAFALALVNARQFATTSAQLEDFNKNLERMVDTKTKEVRSLLDHIPQGILSIEPSGIISSNYSAHLINILGQGDFAGQTFKSTILDKCAMGSDAADQAWQSILACVGDDPLNFEFNAEKFPKELTYSHGLIKRDLRVTWNVEVEGAIVERVLVTLLDVSSEHELQKESDKQKRELTQIQELLENSSSKVAQFFETSTPLLRECEKILDPSTELSISSIRVLFINAHTVKGGARTLKLSELASRLHEMESYYADLIAGTASMDHDRLRAEFHHSMTAYNHYVDINRVKLNRSEKYNKIVIERDLIERQYQATESILSGPDSSSKAVQQLRQINQHLKGFIFEQLPLIFDGYKERASKIAKDLGKDEPRFEFDIDDISLFPHERSVLDACMIHLLRNALDHGIEPPDDREKKGKERRGLIKADAFLVDGYLKIVMQDDGRGLALDVLHQRARQRGWLPAQASQREIASTVFLQGISTAQDISEISGRGVGMSAVRSFLQKAGGDIEIVVLEAKSGSSGFYNFRFEFSFPLSQDYRRVAV